MPAGAAPCSPDTARPDRRDPLSQLAPTLPAPRAPRFQSVRTIGALVLREMSSTYGRSPGGYLWALLEPLGTVILLSLGFSLLIRSPALGTSFILFYATGYLPFAIYLDTSQKITHAMNYSRALLSYPRVSWLDAVLARFVLSVLTNLTVFVLLIGGILLVVDTRTAFEPGPVAAGLAIAALTGLGVGLVNCLIFGLWPVWLQIWGIGTRPLFLASGIFFLYDDMPAFAQDILWWNPLIHATGAIRRGFYSTYDAPYLSYTYCHGLALGLIAIGLLLLRRFYKRVLQQG